MNEERINEIAEHLGMDTPTDEVRTLVLLSIGYALNTLAESIGQVPVPKELPDDAGWRDMLIAQQAAITSATTTIAADMVKESGYMKRRAPSATH